MNIYGGGRLLNTYDRTQYRPIKDDEMKQLFDKITLNKKEFAFPDRLVQDFINDGTIAPTFKKCDVFSDKDFDHLIVHIKKRKNIKKVPLKPGSKKRKVKRNKTRKVKNKSDKSDKTKK
jgi:hypothetical protein